MLVYNYALGALILLFVYLYSARMWRSEWVYTANWKLCNSSAMIIMRKICAPRAAVQERKKERVAPAITGMKRRKMASLTDDNWGLCLWHHDHFSWMLTQFLFSLLHASLWRTPWRQSNHTWQGCQLALSYRSPHHNTFIPTKVKLLKNITPRAETSRRRPTDLGRSEEMKL